MAENRKPTHMLVFGGTGQCGQVFIPRALEDGHRLTLYARNPSKFPQETVEHPNVNIVKGEFTDVEALKEALSKGAELLISFAGPEVPQSGTPITEFYQRLYALLPGSSVRRCLVLSTASYKVPEDKEPFKWWIGILAIRYLGGTAFQDINGLSKATAALPPEIEWTLFRVPNLGNGAENLVRASTLGDGTDGMFLTRKSIAAWLLQEIHERQWIRKAPALSNPSWF